MTVRELELDLDAFEGPFDLLLTLILKEELQLAEVDAVEIVLAFLARRGEAGGDLDLDACGEFLVLFAALLELKATALFGEGEAEQLLELEPEEAAAELVHRLAEYARVREAAAWLGRRLEEDGGRYFRVGPASFAPRPARRLAPQQPARLAAALHVLTQEPPSPSLAHMELRFPPVAVFVERFRALLLRRRRFLFDAELDGLSRVEQAVAFLALLELRRVGEIVVEQAAPFAPIRITRVAEPGRVVSTARSA